MTEAVAKPAQPTHPVRISIHIDRNHFFATKNPMTGAELKALGRVDANFDLFLVEQHGHDKLIGDNEPIALREGMHFISVPRDLTPGS
jgi:hypothetical protein